MERLLREAEEALARSGGARRVGDECATGSRTNGRHSTGWPSFDPRLRMAGRSRVHDPFYFGHARPEVLALVPESARRVLDIGCGAGRLGEAIKARQQAEVVGIELE